MHNIPDLITSVVHSLDGSGMQRVWGINSTTIGISRDIRHETGKLILFNEVLLYRIFSSSEAFLTQWLKGEVALGSVLSIRALRDRTGHLEEFSEEYILFSAGFSP